MKTIVSVFVAAILFASCEKTIELTYKSNPVKLVIEANITNQPGPYFVKLTKSIALSATGSNPTVDNAVVTISDNAGNQETLAAQGNGLYQANTITGVEGRTYTLTVIAEGETYTAQSTMPQRVAFDSIKVDQISFAGEKDYHLIPVYTDPVPKGNNYRFLLSVNSQRINQHFVQNDDIKNGTVNTFPLEYNDDDRVLKQGDVIIVTMQCIDAKVALYYRTLALMGDSGPGGGTTPNNPPSNISNGALGVFSAYTAETRTVTLP